MTHGVLSDSELLYQTDKFTRVALEQLPETALDLIHLAKEHKLTTIWIAPYSLLSERANKTFTTSAIDAGYTCNAKYLTKKDRTYRVKYINAYKAETQSIFINFPQWDLWEWEERDALSVLAGIHYIERALGVSIAMGAPLAGRALFKLLHSQHKAWLRLSELDLSSLPYGESRDMAYHRKIAEPGKQWYIHTYDKNSMYLGACGGAVLGSGTPSYFPPGSAKTPNLKLPGLWRCKIDTNQSRYNGVDMPLLLAKGQEWLTTPLLTACLDLGYAVEVIEGYEWNEHHRMLEQWASHVWNTRQSFNPASPQCDVKRYPHSAGRALAYDASKRVATTSMGLFASLEVLNHDKSDHRPDYWDTVIELAKVRMLANIRQIERAAYPDTTLIGVYTDCLFYLSPVANSYDAIPLLFTDKKEQSIKREQRLGGYKVKYPPIAVTDKLVESINQATSVGNMENIIKAYIKEGKN